MPGEKNKTLTTLPGTGHSQPTTYPLRGAKRAGQSSKQNKEQTRHIHWQSAAIYSCSKTSNIKMGKLTSNDHANRATEYITKTRANKLVHLSIFALRRRASCSPYHCCSTCIPTAVFKLLFMPFVFSVNPVLWSIVGEAFLSNIEIPNPRAWPQGTYTFCQGASLAGSYLS